MAPPLVHLNVVSAEGDSTLPLTHFMHTGVVLPKKGRGTALNKSHAKRMAASLLGVEEADVPVAVDGSQELVIGLAFPERGFTRGTFEVQRARVKAVADGCRWHPHKIGRISRQSGERQVSQE